MLYQAGCYELLYCIKGSGMESHIVPLGNHEVACYTMVLACSAM